MSCCFFGPALLVAQVLSMQVLSPAAAAVAAAAGVLTCLEPQPEVSETFHSIDWLLAASLRRPLVCQPVTKQKSPPMSSSAAPVWGTRLAEPQQSALIRLSVPLRGALSRCCVETLARLRTYRPTRAHRPIHRGDKRVDLRRTKQPSERLWETAYWERVKFNLKVPLETQLTSHVRGLNEWLFPLSTQSEH